MLHDRQREAETFIDATFAPLRATIDALWSTLGLGTPQAKGWRRIGFLATRPGDGTTTMAACAAIGLSRHLGDETLLIEANPGSPRLAAYFKLPAVPGFAELASGTAAVSEVVRRTELARLSAMVAGNQQSLHSGTLASPEFDARLADACRGFERVVLDLPALFGGAEAHTLLWKLDACVLVLRAGSTDEALAESALQHIRAAGVPVIGTILNRRANDLPRWLAGRPPAA